MALLDPLPEIVADDALRHPRRADRRRRYFDMSELKLVWVYPACLGFIAVVCLVLFLRERVA